MLFSQGEHLCCGLLLKFPSTDSALDNTGTFDRHGKKIAVIENEFGEVNIDSSLVTDNLQVLS